MLLVQLVIDHFRNLTTATIEPQAGVNVFYGANGSGKTSILEAIYFLGLGRSFRTTLVQRIIHHDADQFLLFAQVQHEKQIHQIGIERSRQGGKKFRIDGESITSLAPLAKQLPLQLLTTESHHYFHEGPKSRRQFLDGGLFHVEPRFYSTWQQFQKALKQRNAALKSQLGKREIEVWNHEVDQLSTLFDRYRKEYIARLHPILNELLGKLLPELNVAPHLRYSRGWPEEKNLATVLETHLIRDQQLGYTQYGPQRADLQLYTNKVPAGDFLSQGQQKLAAYALHLAQGLLLQQMTGQSPIYLIDDLPSELDPVKRRMIADILARLNAQTFITGITLGELSDMIDISQAKMFHVEHGQVHVPRGT